MQTRGRETRRLARKQMAVCGEAYARKAQSAGVRNATIETGGQERLAAREADVARAETPEHREQTVALRGRQGLRVRTLVARRPAIAAAQMAAFGHRYP